MRKYSLALDNQNKVQQHTENLKGATGFRVRERTWLESILKRLGDILVSLLVLVLGFPFLCAIALLIKITSKGSVFYSQERVGEDGRAFHLYKFRTMRIDSDDSLHREFAQSFIKGGLDNSTLDESSSSIYKLTNDPRITSVGSFLRKTSLDELPQFINILKGEMTLVGPRPPLAYEYECYEDWHKLRLKVKPGLTGLWQVSGRSSVPFHEMVMLDLYYIENWSLLLDAQIIMRTVPVMFTGTGGY
jgi:exopolysaccharide biosynthesis polyprenyl glycosylphosphotransferase